MIYMHAGYECAVSHMLTNETLEETRLLLFLLSALFTFVFFITFPLLRTGDMQIRFSDTFWWLPMHKLLPHVSQCKVGNFGTRKLIMSPLFLLLVPSSVVSFCLLACKCTRTDYLPVAMSNSHSLRIFFLLSLPLFLCLSYIRNETPDRKMNQAYSCSSPL